MTGLRERADVHLPKLRARRAELAAQLVTIDHVPAPVVLERQLVDGYLRDLGRSEEVINADLAEGHEAAAQAIRDVVDTVTIVPTPTGGPPGVIVRGRLQSLLGLDPFPQGSFSGGECGAG